MFFLLLAFFFSRARFFWGRLPSTVLHFFVGALGPGPMGALGPHVRGWGQVRDRAVRKVFAGSPCRKSLPEHPVCSFIWSAATT